MHEMIFLSKLWYHTVYLYIPVPNRLFWKEARVRDVLHVIYSVIFGWVLLSLCRIVRNQETTPQPPPPPIRDNSGMRACANATASIVRRSICLASLDIGRLMGGLIYIGEFVEDSPLKTPPWG